MKCPFCGSSNIRIVDSRDSSKINGTRRRRKCLDCGKRFSTIETVIKKDEQIKFRI